jgi:hypothetical protein
MIDELRQLQVREREAHLSRDASRERLERYFARVSFIALWFVALAR